LGLGWIGVSGKRWRDGWGLHKKGWDGGCLANGRGVLLVRSES